MNCCICGKEVEKTFARKWIVCKDVKCTRERDRRKSAESQSEYRKRLRSGTPLNQKRMSKMKTELPDKETFAQKISSIGGNRAMAKKYGIPQRDITAYRIELFGDMPPKEIHKYGRELTKPKKIGKPFERRPIPVQVYLIKDRAKFEQGGTGTYEGLEFNRIEYANEIALHNKSELLEVM